MIIRIIVRVVIRAVVTIITTVIVWIWIIIIWRVWVGVIIWTGLPTALHTDYSVLRKSNQANRVGVRKMIFPSFESLPVHSFMRNEVCFSPKSHYFFFGHVRFDVRNMARVARRKNENKSNQGK